jgi:ribosomal protein L22
MADEEQEVEVPAGSEASEEKAAKKPAAKKAPAAKKDAVETPVAAEKTEDTEQKPAADKQPAAEKEAAADKQSHAKKEADEDENDDKDGQRATLKAPAKAKRAAKKAVESKAAAPAGGEEAKEVAKAQDAAKPSKKLARTAAASVKGPPTRRAVHAHARYVRTSARKARMVCGHLRGKSIPEARAILAFTPRAVARDWSKLLESAIANAENNHELLEEDLVVRDAFADEGPTIKRFRANSRSSGRPILKRTSHLTITLTPRPEPGTSKKHG